MNDAQDIRLRAMEPEDLDLLYRIENDVELWDVGPTNVPYSRYLLHDYIANTTNDIFADRQVRMIIERDGQVVGMLDLTNFDPKHQRAEVGLVVERPFRRRGIALTALARIERYARATLHLRQLYAVIAAGNTPARLLFGAAGYEEVACLPQWLASASGYQDAVIVQRLFD